MHSSALLVPNRRRQRRVAKALLVLPVLLALPILVILHADAAAAQRSEHELFQRSLAPPTVDFRALESTELRLGTSQQTVMALLATGLDLDLLAAIPSAESASDTSLPLSLLDALERALRHNLAPTLQTTNNDRLRAERRLFRAALLPTFDASFERRRDEFNFEASAFARFRPNDPNAAPVLAFDLFDARLQARWRLFDLPTSLRTRAASRRVMAGEAVLEAQRSSLILLAGNLYYRVVLLERRTASAEERQELAQELLDIHRDRLQAGLSTPSQVLDAEVRELHAAQDHQLLRAELEKAKLRLARITGLPLGQPFHVIDRVHHTPMRAIELREAVQLAHHQRDDLRALRAEIDSTRARLAATRAERLPSVELEADWGEIGPRFDQRRETYGAAAAVSLPLYRGGADAARRDAARSELRAAELRLAAAETAVYYEVAEGLIDEQLTSDGVDIAARAVELAEQLLSEQEDRLKQGLSSRIAVSEAALQLSLARDRELDAILAHRTAKGTVARAIGLDESAILEILRAEVAAAAEAPQKSQSLQDEGSRP